MIDYFATQRTGTPCAPFNCAAASGAMGLAFGSGNRHIVSADAFRAQAGVSCVPGVHSASGGLFISDVERVFALHDIAIDYGRAGDGQPNRWSAPTLALKLTQGNGAVVLGDYDALPLKYRKSATFKGDHSAWVHDFRAGDGSVCWHDPLGSKPERIPMSAVLSYWQKPGSPVRGFAGFVKGKEEFVPGIAIVHMKSKPGMVTVKKIDGVQAVQIADLERFGMPAGTLKGTIGTAVMKSGVNGIPAGTLVYIVGEEAAVIRADQVTFEEFEA